MSFAATPTQPTTRRRQLRTLIVGAGFGGIATAIELQRHGLGEVTILEKAPDLGGTWFYNGYPGAACDVPSHLYSFSYAQRRDWSRLCSPQREIHEYLRAVAREHDIERLIHTGRAVTCCRWDEQACLWTVRTEQGESFQAEALVLATGQLHKPLMPRIEGIESFLGHSFHSAEWDHDYPLAGKRVGVVGTGASAVQFVPEIAPEVQRMTVFQRTGNWFLPRENRPYPTLVRRAVQAIPGVQDARRRFVFEYTETLTATIRHPRTLGRVAAARSAAFMRSQLADPQLRAKAWPDYTFGCKRVLFSSRFLPTLERPNVDLVTERIASVTPTGIRTADGSEHELDCIIWATGFQTTEFMLPMEVLGRDGLALSEAWSKGAHAHLGVCVPGFPNMFMLYGPNTNTSGGSIVFYLETQANYLRQALAHLAARGAASVEVRAEVEHAYDREVQRRFQGTAWMDCDSWYRNEQGRIVANWPGYMREYRSRLRSLDPSEYEFAKAPRAAALSEA